MLLLYLQSLTLSVINIKVHSQTISTRCSVWENPIYRIKFPHINLHCIIKVTVIFWLWVLRLAEEFTPNPLKYSTLVPLSCFSGLVSYLLRWSTLCTPPTLCLPSCVFQFQPIKDIDSWKSDDKTTKLYVWYGISSNGVTGWVYQYIPRRCRYRSSWGQVQCRGRLVAVPFLITQQGLWLEVEYPDLDSWLPLSEVAVVLLLIEKSAHFACLSQVSSDHQTARWTSQSHSSSRVWL